MRLLIYLLAMLTGFSVAEAARPVAVTPASVDATVGRAYTVAAVRVMEHVQVQPEYGDLFVAAPTLEVQVTTEFSTIELTTPVLRHDIILG
jgi:hypothetical protein